MPHGVSWSLWKVHDNPIQIMDRTAIQVNIYLKKISCFFAINIRCLKIREFCVFLETVDAFKNNFPRWGSSLVNPCFWNSKKRINISGSTVGWNVHMKYWMRSRRWEWGGEIPPPLITIFLGTLTLCLWDICLYRHSVHYWEDCRTIRTTVNSDHA